MNGLNLSNIQDAKLGSSQVTALYYGSTKIWENAHDYSLDYLTIEPTEDNDYGVDLKATKSTADAPNVTLSYSKDLINWTTVTVNTTGRVLTDIGFVDVGEKIYLKGVNNAFANSTSNYVYIMAQDNYKVSGNIMSLLYGDNFANQTVLEHDYSFTGLFGYNGNKLADISNLVLPATTLTDSCYREMFKGCSGLNAPPVLPATTLAPNCYRAMFSGCAFTDAPVLSATTLAEHCYDYMFENCTSLVNAPALTATTLATYCYRDMFKGCTSLTAAPALSATTLEDSCYREMFNGCTSLTTAPVLPATTLAPNCYRAMFQGCTSLVNAPVLPAETLTNYCYYYMFNGCTSLTTAPVLPALTLVSNCYGYMFYNCNNLNYIKAMFKTAPTTSYTKNWVSGVAASGTYIKNASATYTTRGTSAIPTGWTLTTASS